MGATAKLPVLELLSDEMRAVLARGNPPAPGEDVTSVVSIDGQRRAYAAERAYWNEGGPVMSATVDAVVDTDHGAVPIRLYSPVTDSPLPAILFIHGGGWIVGSLDTHDRIMRTLAHASGCVVVGIDYTLSPEVRFPVAIEQCGAVARHLHRHGSDYGVDGERLAVAGDSAGASMSLGTALLLRDRGGHSLRALALFYGLFGLRDSVARRILGGPWDGLDEADLDFYLECYLADPEDVRHPWVDNLSADLSWGIPPTYLASAEFDPLRDDSIALATVLDRHGVECLHEVFPGVLHAFLHYSRQLTAASDSLRHSGAFLRRALIRHP